MSDSKQPVTGENDAEIIFTLGKGNQSAICGGVKPMQVVEVAVPADRDHSDPKSTNRK